MAQCKKIAENRFFKNTKGRFAIVRDLATHQFIIQNFSARNIWIGLQYFCRSKTLKWVDGSDAAESNFSTAQSILKPYWLTASLIRQHTFPHDFFAAHKGTNRLPCNLPVCKGAPAAFAL